MRSPAFPETFNGTAPASFAEESALRRMVAET
jgi:hypothetical protein